MSCFYFVGDPFTRDWLRADRFGYNAFWRVHLNGDIFIDRFEWGEVCICTLCAVKYKGGASNGSRNAKSDVVRKRESAVNRRRCEDQGGRRNGDVTGVGYSAAMNLAEQWTPNGSNRQRGGLYRVKWRLHERSCRRVLPNAERETDEKQSFFAQPDGKRAGARWHEIR